MSDYNPAIHNPSASMGAGTGAPSKGVLLLSAIPHVGMGGKSVFGCLGLSTAGALLDQATGVKPELMRLQPPPTPGAIGTEALYKGGGGKGH